jgi:predicted DsbA family dithiol-disulfide isomerase
MRAPVRLDAFSDYLCPWCYNAAVRLREIQAIYGDRVRVHWRAFPLVPGQEPDRRVTQKTRDGWQRIGAEEPRTCFRSPAIDAPLPSSSIPALTAAKCAERQGEGAFDRLHDRLFTALFRDHLDIGCPEVLRALARETALDLTRFERDYTGEAYEAVLRDCAEGTAWFGVSRLPTVIVNEKLSLVGAVPTDRYRLLIDWILESEGASSPQVGASTAPSEASPRDPIAAAKPPLEPRSLERACGGTAGWSSVDAGPSDQ